MGKFRFEDLQIWQSACALGYRLDAIADEMEKQGRRRYAEQLRGAALSVSNNIAEGSCGRACCGFSGRFASAVRPGRGVRKILAALLSARFSFRLMLYALCL
jgi:hypothetical protein